MTGLLLLTLRELRARKVIVGLFVVATAVWLTLSLALQLDVVDGSLAGARLFGNAIQDDAATDSLDAASAAAGEAAAAAKTAATDSLGATAGPDSLAAMADAGAAGRDAPGTPADDAPEPMSGPLMGNPLQALVFGAQAFASGAAYWVGILLCLFATGGLVAGLVEPGQADLLLSKPLSRSAVLAGRLAGVGVVTLALLTYLLGAVWLVMAVKTGFWNPRFLLAIPAVWAMFAVLYGVVTLVSVWSGSGPLALVVTLGLVFTTLVLAIPGLPLAVNASVRPVVTGLGAVLPRFATVGANLVPHLAAGAGLATLAAETGAAQPAPPSLVADTVPLLTSLLFGAVCYAAAFALFHRRDA